MNQNHKTFLVPEIIKNKRDGLSLQPDEISFIVDGYVAGRIPDYQMAAFLMAVLFQDMDSEETWTLTEAMMNSGRVFDFSHLGIPVDKHSTGGVGDKTSLILAAIAAAAGVPVPMIAGRGLGHTGGTIDKLESIPGFTCDITIEQFEKQVKDLGVSLIGQTKDICPADKRIYGLRDVTATVESLPLICASIMSKKLAEGISALVLDVKWGSGAFMKTREKAIELAERLCTIGKAGGKHVVALVTDMNQPLGRFIGNSLEVEESIGILRQESVRGRPVTDFADCEELSITLSGTMIWLGKQAATPHEGIKKARELLLSGKAFAKFEELIKAQGGELEKLPKATLIGEVLSESTGYLTEIDTEQIGYAGLVMGAGRAKTSDLIEPSAGIECLARIGDKVEKGQPLYRIYGPHADYKNGYDDAVRRLTRATRIDKNLQIREANALITHRIGIDL